jgi:hypothetical protein
MNKHHLLSMRYRESILGEKAMKREAKHLPPSSTDCGSKNEFSCTSILRKNEWRSAFIRDNFGKVSDD